MKRFNIKKLSGRYRGTGTGTGTGTKIKFQSVCVFINLGAYCRLQKDFEKY
jgi:hypothetical protein